MFSYSYASWILMSMICWVSFAKVWKTYKERQEKTLGYFGYFFAYLGIFFLVMGMPVLFIGKSFNASQLGAFYIFGHMFLYAAVAYYSRIPMSIWKPDLEMPVFGLNLIWGMLITLVNIAYWNMPEISSNITALNVAGPLGPMIGIMMVLNLVIGGTYLFGKMSLSRTGHERNKLILIALGLLLVSTAGPIHDMANSFNMVVLADILTFVGVVSLMAGIYLKTVFGSNL